jgi:membrane-associated protease RseP (regulator of RpoE activity)
VSSNGSRYPEYRVPDLPPEAGLYVFAEHSQPRHRYWLHFLLLFLTLITTSVVGAGLAASFAAGTPFHIEDIYGYQQLWRNPAYLLNGLPFSVTLLGVLLAHEMGHFWTARYYGVDASLPYFLPVPTLIGTFGAFIRIRSAIVSKRILFDIGIAGPIGGFLVLLLPLIAGVSLSKVIPGLAESGDVSFGTPLLIRALEWAMFPGVEAADIYLHPVARAAWVGVLATALNLLPIGQLDGGHILYAFFGERVKYFSWLLVAAFIPMGFFFAYSWWFWAILLLFFGMRHPSLVDPTPIGRTRTRLAFFALFMLVVCFTPSPIR